MQQSIVVKPVLSEPVPRHDDSYVLVVSTSIEIEENHIVTANLPDEFVVDGNSAEVILGTVEIDYLYGQAPYPYEQVTEVNYSHLEIPPDATKIVVKTKVTKADGTVEKDKGESTYHWNKMECILK